ncbi:Uncharacterized protein FWK35_00013312 [Aphis craccivora]|uniref:Uncharacterized protein n=1 Tax=Aphis craccivora TaxID=307492 RepID=A0A6G0YPA1_APHCR|nr:Uncharacterized protein FWK35_00013312 [Aphis craccivora]
MAAMCVCRVKVNTGRLFKTYKRGITCIPNSVVRKEAIKPETELMSTYQPESRETRVYDGTRSLQYEYLMGGRGRCRPAVQSRRRLQRVGTTPFSAVYETYFLGRAGRSVQLRSGGDGARRAADTGTHHVGKQFSACRRSGVSRLPAHESRRRQSYYNTNRVQGGTYRYLLGSCFIGKTNKMDRCDAKPNRDGH